MKNSAGRGGCYPTRQKVKVDNSLQDLQNSSYPKKAEFNNCFLLFKLVNLFTAISLFVKKKNLVPRFSRSMVQ